MHGSDPEELLPSIAHLLKSAGALERTGTADLARVASLPVFQTESWRRSIADFLRWSGSTLSVGSGASVFELLLRHGRAGALALDRAFRRHLIESGVSIELARLRLEAVRAVVAMAAHWIREIDWDLSGAEDLRPEDFAARRNGPGAAVPPAASARPVPVPSLTPPSAPAIAAVPKTPLPAQPPLTPAAAAADSAPPLYRNDPTVRSLWKLPRERREEGHLPAPSSTPVVPVPRKRTEI